MEYLINIISSAIIASDFRRWAFQPSILLFYTTLLETDTRKTVFTQVLAVWDELP
mgnify:CR=1 FL=1